MPLTFAPMGIDLQVCKVNGKDDTKKFLANLGFVEGSNISVVSANHGNLIIRVYGSKIALDRSLSSRILVNEVSI